MKKLLLSAMVLAVAGLASCKKDNVASNDATTTQSGEMVKFTLSASSGQTDDSRVSIGTNGLTLNWEATDKLTVFQSIVTTTPGDPPTYTYTSTVAPNQFTIVDAASYTSAPAATFEGVLPAPDFSAGGVAGRQFYAVCCGSDVTMFSGAAVAGGTAVVTRFDTPPVVQTVNLEADGTTSKADLERYFVNWAEPKDFNNVPIVDNDLGDFKFHMLNMILDFNIQNIPDGCKITAVAISQQENVSGYDAPFQNRVNVSIKSFTGGNGFLFASVVTGQFFNEAMCTLASPVAGTGTNSITPSMVLLPRDAMYSVDDPATKQNNGVDTRNMKITVYGTSPIGLPDSWTFTKSDVETGKWGPGVRTTMTLNLKDKPSDSPAVSEDGKTILITKKADLDWVRANMVNANGFAGLTLQLQNNIDLETSSTSPWAPLAGDAMPFAGVLDGSNDGGATCFTISGLYVAPVLYPSLLGYCKGADAGHKAVVRNLILDSPEVHSFSNNGSSSTTTTANVGITNSLAGFASRAKFTEFTNCRIKSANLKSDAFGNSNNAGGIGGIVGTAEAGVVINNCHVEGGFVGCNYGSNANMHSTGGIVGRMVADATDGGVSVVNCSNAAKVFFGNGVDLNGGCTTAHLGGIAGVASGDGNVIAGCKNSGTVYLSVSTNNRSYRTGGICGMMNAALDVSAVTACTSIIVGCYNTGTTENLGGFNGASPQQGGICGVMAGKLYGSYTSGQWINPHTNNLSGYICATNSLPANIADCYWVNTLPAAAVAQPNNYEFSGTAWPASGGLGWGALPTGYASWDAISPLLNGHSPWYSATADGYSFGAYDATTPVYPKLGWEF